MWRGGTPPQCSMKVGARSIASTSAPHLVEREVAADAQVHEGAIDGMGVAAALALVTDRRQDVAPVEHVVIGRRRDVEGVMHFREDGQEGLLFLKKKKQKDFCPFRSAWLQRAKLASFLVGLPR
jgi:hypothetical protein